MVVKWLIHTVAIMISIKTVPGINYSGNWQGILLVGALFGLLNTYIRPVVRFFTFPILLLSLGLFSFIINAMMLSLTSWLSDQFSLGFQVKGFRAAFLGSLLISFVSMVLSCLMPPERISHPTPKVD